MITYEALCKKAVVDEIDNSISLLINYSQNTYLCPLFARPIDA